MTRVEVPARFRQRVETGFGEALGEVPEHGYPARFNY